MRRILILALMCVLLLPACSQVDSTRSDTSPVDIGTSSENGTAAVTAPEGDQSTQFNKDMAQGVDGSMFMTSISSGYIFHLADRLYYAERESMASTLLCALPECEHNDEDCNAYLNQCGACVSYDGKLYYIDGLYDSDDGSNFGLYSMSYSGDTRKMVTQLDGWSIDGYTADASFALSGSDLIYSPDGRNVYYKSLASGENVQIYAYDGPTDTYNVRTEDGKTVYDTIPVTAIWATWIDDETMYFIGTVPLDEYTWGQQLYAYTPGDESAERVWTVPSSTEAGTWTTADVYVNGWYLDDGVLYYFLSENGVWQYDLTSGEASCLFSVDETISGAASFDEQYVYIVTSSEILAYDYTGEQVGTISVADIEELLSAYTLGDLAPSISILGTDDNYIFIYYQTYGPAEATDDPDVTISKMIDIVCYAEKTALGDGTPVQSLIER